MSVDYYSFAWTKDPIVAGFIAESGTASNQGGPQTNITALSAGWYSTSQKLGCGGAEAGEATLACMRKQKWEAITNAIEKRGVTPNMGAGGFGPTYDDKVVFSNYTKLRAEGKFAKLVSRSFVRYLHDRTRTDYLVVAHAGWPREK
jgi:cholinesterase